MAARAFWERPFYWVGRIVLFIPGLLFHSSSTSVSGRLRCGAGRRTPGIASTSPCRLAEQAPGLIQPGPRHAQVASDLGGARPSARPARQSPILYRHHDLAGKLQGWIQAWATDTLKRFLKWAGDTLKAGSDAVTGFYNSFTPG